MTFEQKAELLIELGVARFQLDRREGSRWFLPRHPQIDIANALPERVMWSRMAFIERAAVAVLDDMSALVRIDLREVVPPAGSGFSTMA